MSEEITEDAPMDISAELIRPNDLHGHRPTRSLEMTRLERASGWVSLDLREIWRFRELLYFLTWRDVIVRY